MAVEKEVGDSEALEMTFRPGLSETTSNAALPVTTNQSVNTVLPPVVPHDAGGSLFFPCHRTSDQITHAISFVYK